MKQNIREIAASIDLRMKQLEEQGITGTAVTDYMLGFMPGLQTIYDQASDAVLEELCVNHPGFYRYAGLMEEFSELNRTMKEAGTHPYADLPVLSDLERLMSSAAELERMFQSALDSGEFARYAKQLDELKHQWGDDLGRLVETFRSSDLPLIVQAVVQSILKAMAERIVRLGEGEFIVGRDSSH